MSVGSDVNSSISYPSIARGQMNLSHRPGILGIFPHCTARDTVILIELMILRCVSFVKVEFRSETLGENDD